MTFGILRKKDLLFPQKEDHRKGVPFEGMAVSLNKRLP